MSRPRPRSASLKALPPDQPVQTVEVQNISPAVHWSVNSKEKPGVRPRPLKSVSLKLAKGDGSPTAATRSNSAGAAWGSGELLIDGRQCIHKAGAPGASGASGPDRRGTEADKAGRRPSALPRSEFIETPARPPGLPKAAPSTSSYPSRPTAAVPDDEARPSSASYQRAAAIYASLPTPGGTRTLVRDADGFIFRPTVEAEVKAAPPQRLRPGSRGLNELVASLTKPRENPRPAEAHPVEVPRGVSTDLPDRPDRPEPRIAWSEGAPDDAVENFFDASDLAAQIRRDWLAKQLSELEASSCESKQDGASLRTEDGRRSMGELERSLAKAKERAEKNRKELKGYMESLRSKLFQADGDLAATNEELLVSLPPDFDDVVDINASLTSAERRRSKPRSISSEGGSELAEGFRLPTFLEKYFYDEKAVELPIVQMQHEDTELDKVARQVARLDALLSRREADGLARLKAAKEELAATKEHLRRESEQSEAEKIELLKKLKEKGFLRSSSSTSKAASAASSSANSPRHSSSVACMSPSKTSSEVDWSGWECSVELETPSTAAPAKSAPFVAQPGVEHVKEDEADTSTFLTATADRNLGPRTGKTGPRSKLEPVVEDTVHERKNEEQEETPSGDERIIVPSPFLEELLHDPYDLNALHAIDDKLAQLVPESEWEAKSIRSATNGSEVSAGVQSKTSKHTVFSHVASSLPGEPVLREQLEEREARKALMAIDDALGRLQEQRQSEQLQPEQLQQLLLQAAASQSAMDSSSKVLTLTAEAGDLEASLQQMLQPLRITTSSNMSPESTGASNSASGALLEAKQILLRLSESNEEWDSTNMEVRCTMAELEDSVRALEEQASRPTAQKEEEPTDDLMLEMSTWATKLEELSREALLVAEQGLPQVQEHTEPDAGGASASVPPDLQAVTAPEGDVGDAGDEGDLGRLVLPSLTMAEEADDGLLDSDAESGSSGNSPVFLPAPEVEVTKALDLDLPEGRWSDEELEKLSRAMEEHFGPVKRSFMPMQVRGKGNRLGELVLQAQVPGGGFSAESYRRLTPSKKSQFSPNF